jgi:hypothetical protein
MKKLLIFIVLLFSLASCAVNKDLPQWIKEFQPDPAHFSALVKVKTTMPNYRDWARETAAAEITMQISTVVESEIKLTESETMGVSGSEYISQIRSSSNAQLRELSPIRTYESKGMYYVLYRVRKADYYAQRAHQRDLAVHRALELVQQFDDNAGNPALAIPYLLSALDLVSGFLDMELSTPQGNIANNIYSRLLRLPLMINYAWDDESISAKARSGRSITVSGRVWQPQTSAALTSIALSAKSATISFPNPVFSDTMGRFNFIINRIESQEAVQTVNLSFCKEHYQNLLTNPTAKIIWQNVNFGVARLRIDVQRPLVFLDYAYLSGFQGGYRELIAGALANLNIGVAQKLSDAEYLLKIRVEPTGGEYLSNMKYYTAIAGIQMSLIDPLSGATVNYLEHSAVKSGGNTREAAERNAERDSASLIGDSLLYRLLYPHLLK